MAGNTIATGMGLASGDIEFAVRRGFAIPMFVFGMLLSRFWMRLAQRRHLGTIAAPVAYCGEACRSPSLPAWSSSTASGH